MKRLFSEFSESVQMAWSQIAANRTRSILTALGVVIGIIAVTLMGTAINGIDTGFDRSLSLLGDDVLYVTKNPWGPSEDFANFRNRRKIATAYADRINRIIADRPATQLEIAVPAPVVFKTVTRGQRKVDAVYTLGTTNEFTRTSTTNCERGRFLTEPESRGGFSVCVIGLDIATSLFPSENPLGQTLQIGNHAFRVVGVFAKQGSFLGLFSWDQQVVIPVAAFKKYFVSDEDAAIRVKVKSKLKLLEAKEELTGIMRRLRGLMPEQRDDFSINENQAFRSTIGPIKTGIALAGIFITGLSLFVGAIGIMNITFVSVKERTREIGTRKALGARRVSILLQFLTEAVTICVIGGLVGIALSGLAFWGLASAVPSFPVSFSFGLTLIALCVSVATGIISGFAPAWSASRLDPIDALRYE